MANYSQIISVYLIVVARPTIFPKDGSVVSYCLGLLTHVIFFGLTFWMHEPRFSLSLFLGS